jgi:hypothetical protein
MSGAKPSSDQAEACPKALQLIDKANVMSTLELVVQSLH